MTTPAVTIQDCIDYCGDNIAEISYDAMVSVQTQMAGWITTMFGSAAGIFRALEPAGQRRVADWYGVNNQAYDLIESATPGTTGVESTSAVIDAVVRTLYAVRDARAATQISAAQVTATIAAFNLYWT